MRMNCLLVIFFIVFSSPGIAAEEDYKFCTVGGYFSGTNDKFLSGLAAHVAQKKNIFGNPICNAAWENGYRIGEKLSETGKIKEPAEREIIHQATAFSAKIYEAISSRINF
jgi:hypothetical protein